MTLRAIQRLLTAVGRYLERGREVPRPPREEELVVLDPQELEPRTLLCAGVVVADLAATASDGAAMAVAVQAAKLVAEPANPVAPAASSQGDFSSSEFGNHQGQAVTLSAQAQATPPGDVGDSLSTAFDTGPIPASGTFISGQRIGDGPFGDRDVDLFAFQAAAGNLITLTTSQPLGGAAMDTYLRLFDATGSELLDDDDNGEDAYSEILHYVITEPGTYYVGVSGFGNSLYDPTLNGSEFAGDTGDYDLSITRLNSIILFGNGQFIPNGDTSPSLLEGAAFGRADLLSGAVSRTFTIRNSNMAAVNLIEDPHVKVTGPAASDFTVTMQPGSPIASNSFATFQVVFDPSAAGLRTATISIASDDSSENPYTFEIEGTGTVDVGDTLATAFVTGPVPASGTLVSDERIGDGAFGAPDVDVFSFYGFAGTTVSITTAQPSGGIAMDTYLRLFDASGQLLTDDDDSANERYSEIRFSLTATGTYYVGVSGFPNSAYDPTLSGSGITGSTGNYNLSLKTDAPEIEVFGGEFIAIRDGDTTPSLVEGTDFGSAVVSRGSVTYGFRIRNANFVSMPLHLTGEPPVQIIGPGAGEFSVTTQPGSLVEGGSGVIFEITFNPTVSGLRTATVHVTSDDNDESAYEFVIQGRGEEPVLITPGSTVSGFIFDPQRLLFEQFSSPSIVVADFNSDGRDDLVLSIDNHVLLLRSQENDSFVQVGRFSAREVAVGDFDGDDLRDDLVIAKTIDGDLALSMLLEQEDGTFREQERFSVGPGRANSIAVADFNADGRDDLILATSELQAGSSVERIAIVLIQQDRSFVISQSFLYREDVFAVVAHDFNDDQRLDLAIASSANDRESRASIQTQNADGTFQEQQRFTFGGNPSTLTAADFNNDGHIDLAGANSNADYIVLHLGTALGHFGEEQRITVGDTPSSISAADFNRDGLSDVVVANVSSDDVSVLLQLEEGGFGPVQWIGIGSNASSTGVGDFNRDGAPDLAVGYFDGVALLLGGGDGTFPHREIHTVSVYAIDLRAGDFVTAQISTPNSFPGPLDAQLRLLDQLGQEVINDDAAPGARDPAIGYIVPTDGRYYLEVTATQKSSSARLGDIAGPFSLFVQVQPTALSDAITSDRQENRYGVFLPQPGRLDIELTTQPTSSLIAELALYSSDGQLLVNAPANGEESSARTLSQFVLPGHYFIGVRGVEESTGQYELALHFDAAISPINPIGSLGDNVEAAADFNSDGRLDLVRDGSVLLGLGDGSFIESFRFEPGGGLVVGDVNDDGRLDIVNRDGRVLLGNGNGAFVEKMGFNISGNGIAIDLFDDDEELDVAIVAPGKVSILLGQGDGSFELYREFEGPEGPFVFSIQVGQFNADRQPDLVVGSVGEDTETGEETDTFVTILLGQVDGSFSVSQSFEIGTFEIDTFFAVGDFDDNKLSDLAVTDRLASEVSVLLNRGDTFQERRFALDKAVSPEDIFSGDFDSDGNRDDLVLISSSRVEVFYGEGNGSFSEARVIEGAIGGGFSRFHDVTEGDFNQDSRVDLVSNGQMLLGRGDGTFFPLSSTGLLNTADNAVLIADINGDGMPDSVTIDKGGRIEARLGGADGSFAAPIVINRSLSPEDGPPAARQVTIASDSDGSARLVAIDTSTSALSVYTINRDGTLATFESLVAPAGSLLARVHAADLNGDGNEDLIVSNPGLGKINVLLAGTDGSFRASVWTSYDTGNGALQLTTALVDGDAHLDLVVANQASGDVSVRLNDGSGNFGREQRYRVTDDPYGLGIDPLSGRLSVLSEARTNDAGVADFNGDGHADILVVNSVAKTFSLLLGLGDGRFPAPREFPTSGNLTALDVGEFDDDDFADAVFLDADAGLLLVYAGAADGTLTKRVEYAVGDFATSVQVQDVTGPDGRPDGVLDLVVGNEFGDVLVFAGKGDGSFESFRRVDLTVTLVVADLDSDGDMDVVTSNESRDQVSVQFGEGNNRFTTDSARTRSGGVLAPGAVKLVDVDTDGVSDLVVANGGSNEIFVYRGVGGGEFAPNPQKFFAGTNPVGITEFDVNGDTFSDLVVANQGSNDVSILLNQGATGDAWQGYAPGPRLDVGEGPVSVEIRDVAFQSSNGPVPLDTIPDLVVTNAQSGNVQMLPGRTGGFFSDLAGDVGFITLPGPTGGQGTLFAGDIGFAPGANGDIFRIDLTTNTASVPDSLSGLGARYVSPLAVGDGINLAVASSRGSVLLLVSADGEVFTTSQVFSGLDPSSVVLEELADTGVFQIYVTEQGEDVVTVLDVNISEELDVLRAELEQQDTELTSSSGSVLGFGQLVALLRTGLESLLFFSIDPLLGNSDEPSSEFSAALAELRSSFAEYLQSVEQVVTSAWDGAVSVWDLPSALEVDGVSQLVLQTIGEAALETMKPAIPGWSVIEAAWQWWSQQVPDAPASNADAAPTANHAPGLDQWLYSVVFAGPWSWGVTTIGPPNTAPSAGAGSCPDGLQVDGPTAQAAAPTLTELATTVPADDEATSEEDGGDWSWVEEMGSVRGRAVGVLAALASSGLVLGVENRRRRRRAVEYLQRSS